MRRNQASRAVGTGGWSLIEIVVVVSLITVVGLQALTITRSAQSHSTKATQTMVLEDEAQMVLQRIARAVMGSNRESLLPKSQRPLSSSEIEYRVYLGVEDGEIVWDNTERIALDDVDNSVSWTRLPTDDGDPLRVVWTDLVRPYLEGEIPNGMDDNGNGLIDEKGLSFSIDRDAVTIQLTLTQFDEDGTEGTSTVQTTVMCRNPSPQEVN